MIIEFFGIPGSGKSTLCSALQAELTRKNYPLSMNRTLASMVSPASFPRFVMAWELLSYIAGNPKMSVSFFSALIESQQTGTYDFLITAKSWFRNSLRFNKLLASPDIFLFDQAMAQAIWQFYFGANHVAGKEFFSRYFLYPDIVFTIEANKEVIKKRLMERKGKVGRLDQRYLEDEHALDKAERIYHEVKNFLAVRAQTKDFTHVVISNNQAGGLTRIGKEMAEIVIADFNRKLEFSENLESS